MNNGFLNKCRAAFRTVYSFEARSRLKSLIKITEPDVAHVNAFCYQLTPSILYALKECNIPVICRSPEYKFICPNQRLFNLYTGLVCEDCRGGRYYKAIVNRCIKNSVTASVLGCVEAYFYQFLKTYKKTIDLVITPSKFMRDKMIEFGVDLCRIEHIPNFVDVTGYRPNYDFEDYFVYFGSLVQNKGLHTLLKAMKAISGAELKIIGEGEIEDDLKQMVEKESIHNAHFIGYKSGDELVSLVRNCMFTVLPSEMFENCPFSVLESLALGKPVIGANIGGIPELIEDGVDGLLFEPKSVRDLSLKIQFLIAHKDRLPEMGNLGRLKIEKQYNPETYYKRMIKIYEESIMKHKEKA